MISEGQRPPIEIYSANGNLFDQSTLITALLPAHGLVDMIKEAGYAGFEWHPLRGLVGAEQLNRGLVSRYVTDAIGSLHQSYRREANLGEAWRHPNRKLAMISYALLPERIASLDDLEKIQQIVGRELPIVLYPSHPDEESGTSRPFTQKMFQPSSDVMQQWGVHTAGELINETYRRGYTGFCLDLLHMRREAIDDVGLSLWQETLPELLPHTQEIHISAGRFDQAQIPVDSQQELQDLMAGRGDSDLLRMLEEVRESGWSGRVVTEIPAASLRSLRSPKSPFSSIKDLVDDHKRIVGNVQDILS
ncbi:hypothetical protein KBD09_03695 [Candidatus Woesebacteria bacterium]|nr:hypothetical protein [Candidatus Woesebacteria bacterium]